MTRCRLPVGMYKYINNEGNEWVRDSSHKLVWQETALTTELVFFYFDFSYSGTKHFLRSYFTVQKMQPF